MFHYIYGVVDCRKGVPGDLGNGVASAPVHVVAHDGLGALFSEVPHETAIPSRGEVLAHQQVLERALRQTTVLPAAFGTIARDRASLAQLLQRVADQARTLCDHLQGKVEVGLKIFWLPAAVRREVEAADMVRLAAHRTGQAAALEAGRAVAAVVERWKETHARAVVDALRPLAVDLRENPAISLHMLSNVSFLVEGTRAAEFEARVYELDRIYSDRMNLRLAVGLPPYNFVNLRISM